MIMGFVDLADIGKNMPERLYCAKNIQFHCLKNSFTAELHLELDNIFVGPGREAHHFHCSNFF